jgi:hypothetical protein
MVFTFDEQDDDLWIAKEYSSTKDRKPVRLIFSSETEPDNDYLSAATKLLEQIDELILSAAELILENYSYSHYQGLGVAEDKLVNESAEAISKVAVLKSIYFASPLCDDFELSFHLPWDDHHSYDVEFEDGDAVCCTVNG